MTKKKMMKKKNEGATSSEGYAMWCSVGGAVTRHCGLVQSVENESMGAT